MSWEDTIKKRNISRLIDIQENLLSIVEKSEYFKDIPEGKQMALMQGREVLSYLYEQQNKRG